MVDYIVQPCTTPLKGALRVPSDKSISHRALLLSALAEGTSFLHHLLLGADNYATLHALQAMGVTIEAVTVKEERGETKGEDLYQVKGVGLHGLQPPDYPLDLGNSGTSMRLLAGLLAGQSFASQLVGDASLTNRPMKRIVEPLKQMGAIIKMSARGTAPLHLFPASALRAISYSMPIASAQVKSCLLLAGLYAAGKTCVTESTLTRDHTERLLQMMNYPVHSEKTASGHRVCLQGGGTLCGRTIKIPADISSAAFFIVAATLIPDSEIVLLQVGVNPTRTGLLTILKAMGADIVVKNQRLQNGEPVADLHVRTATLNGIVIPIDQVPLAIDELPIALIAASCAKGKTILRGAGELRVKESDRIDAIAQGLKSLGIEVEVFPDGLAVCGGHLKGGVIDSFGDHRIAMSFVIAATRAAEPVRIQNCDNVETSFPGFKEMAAVLGISIEEIDVE